MCATNSPAPSLNHTHICCLPSAKQCHLRINPWTRGYQCLGSFLIPLPHGYRDFLFFFWLGSVAACRILVPPPGMESVSPAVVQWKHGVLITCGNATILHILSYAYVTQYMQNINFTCFYLFILLPRKFKITYLTHFIFLLALQMTLITKKRK